MGKKKKKKPLSWWAVLVGLVLGVLEILDKAFDLVLKVLGKLPE